jgi:catechol 2,3-dioxygenase-like lactoylglutathione lyase family enzyme
MELGNFSLSLAVADLAASQAFYAQLGFEAVGGRVEEGWLMLQNGDTRIGLFQGLFEANLITWNPKDVRAIQARLQQAGIPIVASADHAGEGPAHVILADPDGNRILLDQLT